MTSRGFHTLTLGCKLNQFDSGAIEAELESRGFRREPDLASAAVVIVNTCAVTGRADAEARRLIRRVRRENPSCRLLVTGCYAQIDPGAIRRAACVDRVFGNEEKAALPRILDEMGLPAGDDGAGLADPGCTGVGEARSLPVFSERGRAFLKVQEGCDLGCSYCVIPRARGRSRSVPAETLEMAVRSLRDAGHSEIVLTGVNTGSWGRDLAPQQRLAPLLRRLARSCEGGRIRLNSLEPLTVTGEVVGVIRDEPRLAPHVQIPLQSGSDRILRSMRRNYRPAVYLERVGRLRAEVPHAGIGADVIVGFPGETDADFEETLRLVRDSPLNYLHVFTWSPRPGTPAATLGERPEPARVRDRSARLRSLGEVLSLRFRREFEGKTLEAVVLGTRRPDGRLRVLTGNYIDVAAAGDAAPRSLVPVRIDRAYDAETTGTIVGR